MDEAGTGAASGPSSGRAELLVNARRRILAGVAWPIAEPGATQATLTQVADAGARSDICGYTRSKM